MKTGWIWLHLTKIVWNGWQYCLEKHEAVSEHEWGDNVGNIFERLNDESSDNES